MSLLWEPKRSLAETDAIMCAPGTPFEMETRLVDGRIYRVYKNLSPSLRAFWLECVGKYSEKTYIVFEQDRLTYGEVHSRALEAAAMFRDVYKVQKGDRVGICSRNCPEYLIVFWACHMLGAVTVLANAWLPAQPLQHCLVNTQCKLILLDPERADRLEPDMINLRLRAGATGVLVFMGSERRGQWTEMECFNASMIHWKLDVLSISKQHTILEDHLELTPEDNATIIFTSGTTGLPKGVLSTNRQFLTNVINVGAASIRASLRRGEDIPSLPSTPQKGVLVGVPLFHVTGSTSFSMLATNNGMKIILVRKWDAEQAATLIKTENIGVAGGVPAMVADLVRSSLVGYPLEGLLFGGSPSPDSLAKRAREAFPSATMSQAYGLSETNSVAVSIAAEDYLARPGSTGRTCPVNEIMIMHNNINLGPGPNNVGEVWLRGPNVMKGYWGDPDATSKVLTSDGWLKTGDLGYLDTDGFLYIKDRLKDVIIRGGENIDSVSVENALYSDHRVMEAAAVAVPDERLGELVAAVVYIDPQFCGQVTEASLIALAKTRLPKFAVPVMVKVVNQPFKLTPSRKIMKDELRKIARHSWEERKAEIWASAKL
ncbi:hypothetical protein C8F04DRAFT_438255 [Mycena alexandri]|uniref:4-coumarate--CoA ligase n=1 Tax=Mycena alexandri TaxID=1745969 RepID=A0AAD6THQ1_9AGAR|nr:hypothetical protein C8F04DRAFT_438255 [Mycena alexandri]